MAKKSKAEHRWRISLTGKPPPTILGFINAPTETAALQWAARKFKITSKTLRYRLVAHRAD
jgi:hypothetical protein